MRNLKNVSLAAVAAILLSAAAMAADEILPRRLEKAAPGEWATMRYLGGEHAGKLSRFTLVGFEGEGEDKVAKMKYERLSADGSEVEVVREFDFPMASYRRRLADLEEKAKQISRERFTVKDDKLITVYAVSWEHEGDGENGEEGEIAEIKMWLSDEVPVGGFVKSWSSNPDFPASEIHDFGVN